MAFNFADWAELAEKTRDLANPPVHGGPQVTHAVSKSFSGKNKQDYVDSRCESPLRAYHLHFVGDFGCRSWRSARCDSEFSQRYLTGDFAASYSVSFGHDEARSTDRKDMIEERGYFTGRFDIDGPGAVETRSVMDGMANVGLVRDPLKKPVEECRHPGRWYGRVHGKVHLPDKEIALLIAVIALDVEYELTSSWMGMSYEGTLEGMIVRACERKG